MSKRKPNKSAGTLQAAFCLRKNILERRFFYTKHRKKFLELARVAAAKNEKVLEYFAYARPYDEQEPE